MRTAQDKLKFVMEAAGEKWHKARYELMGSACICGSSFSRCPSNPSPDDIGKLMELARKLNYCVMRFGVNTVEISNNLFERFEGTGEDAEALLNALFVAKGGS